VYNKANSVKDVFVYGQNTVPIKPAKSVKTINQSTGNYYSSKQYFTPIFVSSIQREYPCVVWLVFVQ